MGFNAFPFMQSIARTGLSKQVVNPGDFVGSDGMLICGKCRKPKQRLQLFPNPCDGFPDRQNHIKVVCKCDCDREEEERAAEAQRQRANADLAVKLRGLSLMDEKARQATFSNFQKTQHNIMNLRLAHEYVDRFDEMLAKNQGLLFYGDVGTSKTFLASCIANALIEKGVSVLMTSFVKIINHIDRDEEAKRELVARMASVQLVIFDDLGAERDSNFTLEKIYDIIDSRYRKNLPMIVTTNIPLKEMLEEEDRRYKRIYDRIFEACHPMEFAGPSWRRKMAADRFDRMRVYVESGTQGGHNG